MLLDGSMPAQFVPATSNAKTCLTSFMQDAERSLAALYYSAREICGEQAAHSAAEEWLRIFDERLGRQASFRDSKESGGRNPYLRVDHRQTAFDSATLVILPGISSEASVSTHLAAE